MSYEFLHTPLLLGVRNDRTQDHQTLGRIT